jgi:uncharacterized protein
MYFEIYKNRLDQWQWRLKAANNRIIADSGEAYHNKQDCLHGISLVKQSYSAPIYEV